MFVLFLGVVGAKAAAFPSFRVAVFPVPSASLSISVVRLCYGAGVLEVHVDSGKYCLGGSA